MTLPGQSSLPADHTSFVVSYRVSSRQQAEEGHGLEWQRIELPPYGKRYLGTCLGEYNEGATSTSHPFAERPVLQEMLSDVQTLRPDFLLVVNQDRLSREDDFALIKIVLRQAGTKLAFYREGGPPDILDLSDMFDDFRGDVYAAFAKLDKRKIISQMRRGKMTAAKQGKAMQPVPYGFCKPAPGEVAIEPERAKVVVLIFTRLASGDWSIRSLVRWLNANGIPASRGGLWTVSSLAKLIRNTAYIGRAQMLGVEVSFPPIIDEQTFERAQAAVKQNSERSPRNNTRFDYLIRSLTECGRCQRAITGMPKHNKPYYRCAGKNHDHSKGLPREHCCDQPEVPAGAVDEAVWQAVRELVLRPELISRYARSASTVVAAEATFLRQQLGRFGERRDNVLYQHENGYIDEDRLRERLAAISREQEAAEEKLAELEQATPMPDVDLGRLEEAERLCRELGPKLDTLAFADRRRLVEKLVRRVRLDGRAVTVEVIVPLVEEQAAELNAAVADPA